MLDHQQGCLSHLRVTQKLEKTSIKSDINTRFSRFRTSFTRDTPLLMCPDVSSRTACIPVRVFIRPNYRLVPASCGRHRIGPSVAKSCFLKKLQAQGRRPFGRHWAPTVATVGVKTVTGSVTTVETSSATACVTVVVEFVSVTGVFDRLF